MEKTDPAFPRDHVLLRQRNDMYSNQSPSPHSAGSDGAESRRDAMARESVVAAEETMQEGVRVPRPSQRRDAATAPAGRNAAPRIRWGRTCTALIGVAAILCGLVTVILAPLTAISWTLPVFLLVVGVGAFAGLRYLALADRQQARRPAARRVEEDRASEWAEESEERDLPVATASSEGPVIKGRRDVFDAQAGAASHEEIKAFQAPASQASFDAAPSAQAAGTSLEAEEYDHSQDVPFVQEPGLDIETLREQARRVAAGKPVAFTPATSEWSPVEVPRPTYIDAPEVHRSAPEPVEVPQAPKSTSSTLTEAASKGTNDSRLNLDDVLSRRRA